jgi:hypothetical protein
MQCKKNRYQRGKKNKLKQMGEGRKTTRLLMGDESVNQWLINAIWWYALVVFFDFFPGTACLDIACLDGG